MPRRIDNVLGWIGIIKEIRKESKNIYNLINRKWLFHQELLQEQEVLLQLLEGQLDIKLVQQDN